MHGGRAPLRGGRVPRRFGGSHHLECAVRMAKNPRTPDPPRKVQAPKVRQNQQPAGGGRGGIYVSQTNLLIGGGLIVIAGLIAGLFVLAGRGGSGANVSAGDVKAVRAAMTTAGCTFNASPA